MHDDALAIDLDLVRRLVGRSFPQHADLGLAPLAASGSSNAMFRLGEELLVRLPRQPGGSASIEKEACWLPTLAAGLSVPVPEVVGVGAPGFGYPETWSLTRWIDGQPPAVPWSPSASGPSQDLALDLAQVIAELSGIEVPCAAEEDPGLEWYRGGTLSDIDEDFRPWVEDCRDLPDLGLDLTHALAVWDLALAAEQAVEPGRVWYHGDLFAENLLVRDGRLAAVLDFGGLAVGDGTVDLAVAWEVLDAAGRDVFFDALEVDEGTRMRSMGWALAIAMMAFPYYWHTLPSRCSARRSMAAAVLAEAPVR
jgi:aminoglycoside phosphotransferase (APT) family kinase protein